MNVFNIIDNKENSELFKIFQNDVKLIELRDEDLNTPLIASCVSRNFEASKFLLKNGADVNAKNIIGVTSLMLASQISLEYVELILSFHPTVNDKDTNGLNALAYATLVNNYAICTKLVKLGLDPTTKFYDEEYGEFCFLDNVIKDCDYVCLGEIINYADLDKYKPFLSPVELCWSGNNIDDRKLRLLFKKEISTNLINEFNRLIKSRTVLYNSDRYTYANVMLEIIIQMNLQEKIKTIHLDAINFILKFSNDEKVIQFLENKKKNIKNNTIINSPNVKLCPLCRGESIKNIVTNKKDTCAICLDNVTKMIKYECNHTPCCLACYTFI